MVPVSPVKRESTITEGPLTMAGLSFLIAIKMKKAPVLSATISHGSGQSQGLYADNYRSSQEIMGWLVGFEPTYVRVTVVSVDRFTIATIKNFGAPEGIRTPGPRLRRPLLYPTELQAHMVGETGLEPATPCSQGRCATRLRYSPIHARVDLITTGCGVMQEFLSGP
jgi:hypothetical protein